MINSANGYNMRKASGAVRQSPAASRIDYNRADQEQQHQHQVSKLFLDTDAKIRKRELELVGGVGEQAPRRVAAAVRSEVVASSTHGGGDPSKLKIFIASKRDKRVDVVQSAPLEHLENGRRRSNQFEQVRHADNNLNNNNNNNNENENLMFDCSSSERNAARVGGRYNSAENGQEFGEESEQEPRQRRPRRRPRRQDCAILVANNLQHFHADRESAQAKWSSSCSRGFNASCENNGLDDAADDATEIEIETERTTVPARPLNLINYERTKFADRRTYETDSRREEEEEEEEEEEDQKCSFVVINNGQVNGNRAGQRIELRASEDEAVEEDEEDKRSSRSFVVVAASASGGDVCKNSDEKLMPKTRAAAAAAGRMIMGNQLEIDWTTSESHRKLINRDAAGTQSHNGDEHFKSIDMPPIANRCNNNNYSPHNNSIFKLAPTPSTTSGSTKIDSSSGFSSEGSSSTSTTSASVTSHNQQQDTVPVSICTNSNSNSSSSSIGSSKTSSIRSRLIEDLNRLEKIAAAAAAAAAAANGSKSNLSPNSGNKQQQQQQAIINYNNSNSNSNAISVSPVDSVASQQFASLRPAGEFDYATLCRDEFSSFIPCTSQQPNPICSNTNDCKSIKQASGDQICSQRRRSYSSSKRDHHHNHSHNHHQHNNNNSFTSDLHQNQHQHRQLKPHLAAYKSMSNLNLDHRTSNLSRQSRKHKHLNKQNHKQKQNQNQNRQHQHQHQRSVGGPVLVGVHECDTPTSGQQSSVSSNQHSTETLQCDTSTMSYESSESAATSSSSSSASSSASSSPSSSSPSASSSLSPVQASFVRPLHNDDEDDDDYDDRDLNRDNRGTTSVVKPLAMDSADNDGHEYSTESGDYGGDDDRDRELMCYNQPEDDDDHDEHCDGNRTALDDDDDGSRERPSYEAHVEEYFSDESDDQQVTDELLRKIPQDTCKLAQLCCNDNKLASNKQEQVKFSQSLDSYLARVESLLKLAQGDKSIGFNQLLLGANNNGNRCGDIQVSAEFRTQIEFAPSVRGRQQQVSSVIQEIEMIDESHDKCATGFEPMELESSSSGGGGSGSDVVVLRKVLVDNFLSMLSSPHTSAELNWFCSSSGSNELDCELQHQQEVIKRHQEIDFIGRDKCRELEESLLAKWLKLSAGSDAKRENLVKVIGRHMSEFAATYNTYQGELQKRADFALDWHNNWLFSTSSSPSSSPASNSNKRAHANGHTTGQVVDCNQSAEAAEFAENSTKRAKLTTDHELLNYSTLIIAKYKPIRLTTCIANDSIMATAASDAAGCAAIEQIDYSYKQQLDYANELRQVSIDVCNQIDACRLLLSDSFEEEEGALAKTEANNTKGARHKPLQVKYETSLACGADSSNLIGEQSLRFSSYGHLFELKPRQQQQQPALYSAVNLTRKRQRQLNSIQELVLARLRDACCAINRGQKLLISGGGGASGVATRAASAQQQESSVKFLIAMQSVELVNTLPVIQFCAKIGGSLPIRVSWFKLNSATGEFDEISDKQQQQQPQENENAKQQRGSAATAANWPLTMRAQFDFEHETKWSSVLRFRRNLDDLLFEIRKPSVVHDYNQTYKCVIENYCSISETEFELKLREQTAANNRKQLKKTKKLDSIVSEQQQQVLKGSNNKRSNPLAPASSDSHAEHQLVKLNRVGPAEAQEAGQAILRTWSQRTLKRPPPPPPPTTIANDNDDRDLQSSIGEDHTRTRPDATRPHASYHTQTVGRLSAKAMDDDKFGVNYPYHPECLLRRLEENKLSLTLKSGTIIRRYQQQQQEAQNHNYATSGVSMEISLPERQQERQQQQQQQQCDFESTAAAAASSVQFNSSSGSNCDMQFVELTRSTETFMRPLKSEQQQQQQALSGARLSETIEGGQQQRHKPNESTSGANQQVATGAELNRLGSRNEPTPRPRLIKPTSDDGSSGVNSSTGGKLDATGVNCLPRSSEHDASLNLVTLSTKLVNGAISPAAAKTAIGNNDEQNATALVAPAEQAKVLPMCLVVEEQAFSTGQVGQKKQLLHLPEATIGKMQAPTLKSQQPQPQPQPQMQLHQAAHKDGGCLSAQDSNTQLNQRQARRPSLPPKSQVLRAAASLSAPTIEHKHDNGTNYATAAAQVTSNDGDDGDYDDRLADRAGERKRKQSLPIASSNERPIRPKSAVRSLISRFNNNNNDN